MPPRTCRRGCCRSSASGHRQRALPFFEFVGRVDGRGGFAVVEAEDVTLVARDMAIFTAFFDMSVYPVLDIRSLPESGGGRGVPQRGDLNVWWPARWPSARTVG